MPIKFENVNYLYYPNSAIEYKALENINIDIDDKDYIALIGHTGSGKSTLVQHINALLLPTSGDISVNDYHINNKTKISNIKNLRREAGMVFQFPEYQLFEETCYKDIIFGPKNFGVKEEELLEKAKELIKIVGLDESYLDKSPFEISGGQKRRVAIAGVLAMNPSILILDEPTAGLDPKGANEMLELIDKFHKNGKTIVLVTHEMDYVLKYATKAIVLKEGKVACIDKPINIFSDAKLCEELSLVVPKPIKLALSLKQKGLDININNVIDEQSLINEILKCKGK